MLRDDTGVVDRWREKMKEFNLSEFSDKLRKCVVSGQNGPLIIAAEVVSLADNWEQYKPEADGLTCTQWLAGICGAGKGLGWWQRRSEAVAKIGEHARRCIDHNVAVYVADMVSSEHMPAVSKMLVLAMKQNGGNPLTIAQARSRVEKITGKLREKKSCACCRRYEAIMKKHGIDPNESEPPNEDAE